MTHTITPRHQHTRTPKIGKRNRQPRHPSAQALANTYTAARTDQAIPINQLYSHQQICTTAINKYPYLNMYTGLISLLCIILTMSNETRIITLVSLMYD